MSLNYAYCLVSVSPVRSEKSDASEIISQLAFGELVTLHDIDYPWAKITTINDAYEGFIDHKHVKRLTDKEAKKWMNGLDYLMNEIIEIQGPNGKQNIYRGSFIQNTNEFSIGKDHFKILDEIKNDFVNPVDLAMDYLNTPYLWGGKTPFGIDCSGITQVIYRFFGFNLPRDASEQVDHGMDIEYDEIQQGDLAYFTNSKGKVTHVGILDGKGNIIHASGHVRLDIFSPEGIIHSELDEITHNLSHIKRLQ